MSSRTQPNSENIEKSLLKQQKEVEAEIKSLEQDDPVNSLGMAESSEPGTDSWVADTHGRVMAMKESLKNLLGRIKTQLAALKSGKYGKCVSCGNQIEAGRLSAMPTANLCIACSKKVKK
jgi:RNA polymerase-binding transcription factor DksA